MRPAFIGTGGVTGRCGRLLVLCAALFGSTLSASSARAQHARAGDDCTARPFLYVRHEERAADYADPACQRDVFDSLRYVSLGPLTASFGGELRGRYERLVAEGLSSGPRDDSGAVYARAYLFGELDWREEARLFATLRASDAMDRRGGNQIVDDAGLDLQEAFVEIGPRDLFSLRLGRQEISYPLAPPSRLLSARNGPNVRRTWDGARGIWRGEDARLDAFYAHLVTPQEGAFDDRSGDTTRFWGAFGRFDWSDTTFNSYYYGLLDRASPIVTVGTELRHTLGLRVEGSVPQLSFDYDAEAAWQFGHAGDDDISAGFAALDAGYTFDTAKDLRFGLQLYASTGDNDPSDGRVETFNALFPSGAYLNDAALFRGQNVLSIGANLRAFVTDDLTIRAFYNHYWRTSTSDALYAVSGAVLTRRDVFDAREIGGYAGVRVNYAIDYRTDATVQVGTLSPGRSLRASDGDETPTFARLDLRFRW